MKLERADSDLFARSKLPLLCPSVSDRCTVNTTFFIFWTDIQCFARIDFLNRLYQ